MSYILITVINQIIQIFSIMILVEVIASWVMMANVHLPDVIVRILQVIITINGYVLNPIRRIMPNMGGLDLSPIIALLLLQMLGRVLSGALLR